MRLSASILLTIALSLPLAGSPLYLVTDLGTLGGSKSTGYAINNQGTVVGAARLPSDSDSAFVFSGGHISALTASGATSSQANGINSSGQVAGTVHTLSGAQAAVWTDGIFSNLGTLGGSDSYGLGINNAGSVAGSASLSTGDAHAFLYRNAQMSDLGVLDDTSWSAAYGINNHDQVTGYSTTASGLPGVSVG